MKTLKQHIEKQIAKIAVAEEKIKTATGNHRKNLVKKVCGWKAKLHHLQKLDAWGIIKN
jgi:hypothetical protein